MPKRRSAARVADVVADRLADFLIVQLALAGVPQHSIRKVVGCDMARVVRITKELKAARRNAKEG